MIGIARSLIQIDASSNLKREHSMSQHANTDTVLRGKKLNAGPLSCGVTAHQWTIAVVKSIGAQYRSYNVKTYGVRLLCTYRVLVFTEMKKMRIITIPYNFITMTQDIIMLVGFTTTRLGSRWSDTRTMCVTSVRRLITGARQGAKTRQQVAGSTTPRSSSVGRAQTSLKRRYDIRGIRGCLISWQTHNKCIVNALVSGGPCFAEINHPDSGATCREKL